jgi:hypothetical protein
VSIALIRAGLGKNLATIRGLRVAETIPDQVNPPIAVVSLTTVSYDGALQGGLTTYTFMVTVIVGRISERTAQRTLDAYISPGVGSIKTAIESERSLGGSAFDCRVEGLTSYGSVTIGDVNYLAADFTVTVYGY